MKLLELQEELQMSKAKETRDVLAFMCAECGQGAAVTAGVARLGYSTLRLRKLEMFLLLCVQNVVKALQLLLVLLV